MSDTKIVKAPDLETKDINEKEDEAVIEDDSTAEATNEEQETEDQDQEDSPNEEEGEEGLEEQPQDSDEKEDEANLEDDSAAEDTDEEQETEDEDQEDSPSEDEGEESLEEQSQDKNETNDAGKKKVTQLLKWAGIILLPLLAAGTLFVVKPTIITNLFNTSEQIDIPQTTATQWTAEELEMVNIVGLTLTETEKIWNKIFAEKGGVYKNPDFTIFTNRIRTPRNEKESESESEQFSLGTFYCLEEQRIYIDLSLHRDLKNRLDIPGDFAQGYIVAHEIGHHVQNLIGISEQVPAARLQLTNKEFAMVLQRIELQADCFAGIWAKHTAKQNYNVEPEEFADALNAVTHFSREHLRQKEGDDLMPDPFTHGSSRLRLRWFTIGYNKGTLDDCDTFTTIDL